MPLLSKKIFKIWVSTVGPPIGLIFVSPEFNSTEFPNSTLHRLALDKAPFWLVAVFAYVASYGTSLFSQAGHILLEKRTAPTSGTSRSTLYEQCVGSLTSHVEILNMEGIVRDGAYCL